MTLTLIEKLDNMRNEAIEAKLLTHDELYKNRLMGGIEVYDYVLGELTISECLMNGKHVRIDSPDKFDPYNACKKCGSDIRLKDGKWIKTTYDEREYYNKNNSWENKNES